MDVKNDLSHQFFNSTQFHNNGVTMFTIFACSFILCNGGENAGGIFISTNSSCFITNTIFSGCFSVKSNGAFAIKARSSTLWGVCVEKCRSTFVSHGFSISHDSYSDEYINETVICHCGGVSHPYAKSVAMILSGGYEICDNNFSNNVAHDRASMFIFFMPRYTNIARSLISLCNGMSVFSIAFAFQQIESTHSYYFNNSHHKFEMFFFKKASCSFNFCGFLHNQYTIFSHCENGHVSLTKCYTDNHSFCYQIGRKDAFLTLQCSYNTNDMRNNYTFSFAGSCVLISMHTPPPSPTLVATQSPYPTPSISSTFEPTISMTFNPTPTMSLLPTELPTLSLTVQVDIPSIEPNSSKKFEPGEDYHENDKITGISEKNNDENEKKPIISKKAEDEDDEDENENEDKKKSAAKKPIVSKKAEDEDDEDENEDKKKSSAKKPIISKKAEDEDEEDENEDKKKSSTKKPIVSKKAEDEDDEDEDKKKSAAKKPIVSKTDEDEDDDEDKKKSAAKKPIISKKAEDEDEDEDDENEDKKKSSTKKPIVSKTDEDENKKSVSKNRRVIKGHRYS